MRKKSVIRLQNRRGITSGIMLTVHFAGAVDSSCVPKPVQRLRWAGLRVRSGCRTCLDFEEQYCLPSTSHTIGKELHLVYFLAN